jgi:hypothetical protein
MTDHPALAGLRFLTGAWNGRDDAEQDYHILYGDGRGVSRVYLMSLEDRTWRIWRHTAEFSQRFEAQVDADHGVITGHWEKSHDAGVTWEHDLNVRYTRSGSR